MEAYRAEDLFLEGGGDPPDYLVGQEEEDLSRRDVEEARDKTVKQKAFVSELLNPWVSLFCSRGEEDRRAPPLYLWGCRLLEQFCAMEQDWLERLP